MSKKLKDIDWKYEPSGLVSNNDENTQNVKELLDSTGCGFCLAKFRQVTLHLGTGMTHSCHHPTPHRINPEEIVNNPNLLFNTPRLKEARTQMLNGKKPAECDYCWRIEENDGTSDRHFKSLESWALPDHDQIAALSGSEDIYPSYLEVSFSNVCNMKCVYCGPEFSSQWVEELKTQGPIKLLEGTSHEQWAQGYQDLDTLNYKNREFNPYIDAFWKWFPNALPHLKHYRITGGEPLMSKETFKSIDWLISNPNPEMEFSINSNFSVPEKLWDRFIEKLSVLRSGNYVKKITIYTSLEGWGDRAEYARTGLNFELLRKRYEQILKLGNVRCVVMAAYNILSVTSMKDMLEWLHEMKRRYNPNNSAVHWEVNTGFRLVEDSYVDRRDRNPAHHSTVGIDIPYLRHPTFLDAQIATPELVENYMIPTMDYMATHNTFPGWNGHQGFEDYEIDKFKRILIHRIYFDKKNESTERWEIEVQRAKFYEFVTQMDKRRNMKFLEVFPEMTAFYEECLRCYEKHKK